MVGPAGSGLPVDGLGEVGPEPAREGGPEVMVGGGVKASYRRAAQYGAGWTLGGGTPDQLREGRAALEAAWTEHGRSGSPRVSALTYFSLGPNARENAETYIRSSTGFWERRPPA